MFVQNATLENSSRRTKSSRYLLQPNLEELSFSPETHSNVNFKVLHDFALLIITILTPDAIFERPERFSVNCIC